MFEGALIRVEQKLTEALSSTAGKGISSTKVVWFTNGILACYCSVLATLAGVSVYIFQQKADGIYWTAVGALWTASLGFAQSVKKAQTQAAKEIALANQQTQEQGTTDTGGKA